MGAHHVLPARRRLFDEVGDDGCQFPAAPLLKEVTATLDRPVRLAPGAGILDSKGFRALTLTGSLSEKAHRGTFMAMGFLRLEVESGDRASA